MINLQDKTMLLLPVTSATFPSNLPRDDAMSYFTHLQLYLVQLLTVVFKCVLE